MYTNIFYLLLIGNHQTNSSFYLQYFIGKPQLWDQ